MSIFRKSIVSGWPCTGGELLLLATPAVGEGAGAEAASGKWSVCHEGWVPLTKGLVGEVVFVWSPPVPGVPGPLWLLGVGVDEIGVAVDLEVAVDEGVGDTIGVGVPDPAEGVEVGVA